MLMSLPDTARTAIACATVLRSDGITLVRNDCVALVETPGVSGMPVKSHNNIQFVYFGHAIVPYVWP